MLGRILSCQQMVVYNQMNHPVMKIRRMKRKPRKRNRNKRATFYGELLAGRVPAGGGDPEVDPLTPPFPVKPVVVEVVLVVVVDGVARWAVTVNPAVCRRPS